MAENTSLLALLLVAGSPKGSSVVFSYPAHPKPLPRLSRPIYAKDPHPAVEEDDLLLDGAEQESPAPGPGFFASQREPGQDPYATYLGADIDLLGHALVPQRKELKDGKFEMIIDHLAFIGHAVHLERSRQARASKIKPPEVERGLVSPLLQAQDEGKDAAYLLASVSTLSDLPPTENDALSSGLTIQPLHLDAFNLVLVVDTPPDKHLSNHLDVYYKDVIIKLTAAIKHEEHRNGWLTRESGKAAEIREDCRETGLSVEDCTRRLIAESNLCANLANVFDSIATNQIARLSNFNDHLALSLILHHELFQSSADSYALDQASPVRGLLEEDAQGLHPWQTLLTLQDPAILLKELESTSSSEDMPLIQFLELCTASISFQEYSTLLDIDFASLKVIVDHLIHWRKARIINLVNLKHSYKSNPKLDLRRLPALAEHFAQLFPALPPLLAVLSALSYGSSFHSIITDNSHRALWIDALVWLLSADLVVELRTYYRIAVSPQIKSRAREANGQTVAADTQWTAEGQPASPSNASKLSSSSLPINFRSGFDLALSPDPIQSPKSFKRALGRELSGQTSGISVRTDTTNATSSSDDAAAESASVIAEPGQPTARERQWLTQILIGKPPQAQELFERMLPYLNGRVDLEQLLYRASLTRKQVKVALSAFADHILRFETTA